jgi:hypothetical protein
MNNFYAPAPKELVSDDIKDSLDTEQDYQKRYQDSCITALLLATNETTSMFGILLGIELSLCIKIDIKVAIADAFEFIKSINDDNVDRIKAIALNHDDNITKMSGPFNIVNTKIIEIDANSKTCVLAIDLIKNSLEQK